MADLAPSFIVLHGTIDARPLSLAGTNCAIGRIATAGAETGAMGRVGRPQTLEIAADSGPTAKTVTRPYD